MSDPRDGATREAREAPGTPPSAETLAPGERWKLALAWLVVGLPAAWGVGQVVVKSMALFR
jgi:hypothetical protein